MDILCIKHIGFEGPAAIAQWAQERGHNLDIAPIYQTQHLPSPENYEKHTDLQTYHWGNSLGKIIPQSGAAFFEHVRHDGSLNVERSKSSSTSTAKPSVDRLPG